MRMLMTRTGLALAVLLATLSGQAAAQDSIPRLRILFIGNSFFFFNDMPRTLQTLAMQRDPPVSIEVATVWAGGATLKNHWTDSSGAAKGMIKGAKWDYIVLQEQTTTPLLAPDSMLAYGKKFGDEIRAVGTKALVCVTAAQRSRPPATQDSITLSYRRLADAIGAKLVPAGPAWGEVRKLDPSLELYFIDGSHPSKLGSFTTAVAFYRVLFGEPPRATSTVAWQSVPGFDAPWVLTYPIRFPATTVSTVNRAVEAAMTAVGR